VKLAHDKGLVGLKFGGVESFRFIMHDLILLLHPMFELIDCGVIVGEIGGGRDNIVISVNP